jgi:hypothetical protein
MTFVAESLARMRAWGERHDWRGYDPYDGLTSPLAPALTLGTRMGRRLLTQAVKLSPLNVRPMLGIRRAWNAKAIALVASGYARLAAAGDASARDHAERWLDWLVANHVAGERGLAWGYHFDVQTRVFAYPRETPNTIATSFAVQALLDGHELLGEKRWLDSARAACAFLRDELLADGYFRYLPGEDELVHNANLLACAALARTARAAGDESLRAVAADAATTTLHAQRDDGSWPYADRARHDWVDNFHTAYVLESLAICDGSVPGAEAALARGVAYWEREFFLPDGTPRYYAGRTLPLDAHCYATAVDTWLAVGRPHEAELVALRLVERMLHPRGHVRFQRRRLWTSSVPFVRWTTAPSFRALAGLHLAGAHARLD